VNTGIKLAEIQASCRQCSLSELCLPRGLTDEELTDLEKVVDQQSPIDKHQYLYRNGDKFKSFYAVKSGAMKSVFTSVDGEEQIVGFHLPGELLGLDGLNTKRHTCDCIVLERSSVCELPSIRMEELCRRYSSLHRAMHSIIGKTISEDQSMLLLLARRSAEERLASFLVSLSQRSLLRGVSGSEFDMPMSMRDIANYLGLAPETLSRLVKKFDKTGVARIDKRRAIILSHDKLNVMVADCKH
jgi:CRP/FNR family transcriptional regulator